MFRTSSDSEGYLIRIVELDQLLAHAHVPYRNSVGLRVGESLDVRLEDGRKTVGKGMIEFISPVVNPATGTVAVRLAFDNRERKLASGVPAKLLVPRS